MDLKECISSEVYLYAIRHYTIEDDVIDWADDDTDWGMGYDYDNSYKVIRAPLPDELVVQDGVLTGFSAGGKAGHFLSENGEHEASEIHSTHRYGHGHNWHLIIDEVPYYPHYFSVILSDDEKKSLKESLTDESAEFHKYVKQIVSGISIEDKRGYESENARYKFEFSDYAMENLVESVKWICEFFDGKYVTLLKK